MADKSKRDDAEREHRFREACALQDIESNPLTPEEIATFDMFRREGWSDERVLEFLGTLARKQASDLAAE
jgi:hypothetical protein